MLHLNCNSQLAHNARNTHETTCQQHAAAPTRILLLQPPSQILNTNNLLQNSQLAPQARCHNRQTDRQTRQCKQHVSSKSSSDHRAGPPANTTQPSIPYHACEHGLTAHTPRHRHHCVNTSQPLLLIQQRIPRTTTCVPHKINTSPLANMLCPSRRACAANPPPSIHCLIRYTAAYVSNHQTPRTQWCVLHKASDTSACFGYGPTQSAHAPSILLPRPCGDLCQCHTPAPTSAAHS